MEKEEWFVVESRHIDDEWWCESSGGGFDTLEAAKAYIARSNNLTEFSFRVVKRTLVSEVVSVGG